MNDEDDDDDDDDVCRVNRIREFRNNRKDKLACKLRHVSDNRTASQGDKYDAVRRFNSDGKLVMGKFIDGGC